MNKSKNDDWKLKTYIIDAPFISGYSVDMV